MYQKRTTNIDDLVEDLLQKDLIEFSYSPYAFPVVLAYKKDDGKKSTLCIDYRKLDDITLPEKFPFPKITEIENLLVNAKFFSTFDVLSGFHHIKVNPKDREKTAFITNSSHYQWQVMPFGLKNAPIFFQRALWNLLKRNNLTSFTHNHMDDIIVFFTSLQVKTITLSISN